MSTLAEKYLGSALKFYALAKYNNISNPSRVDIGQDIKIPLTQLAKTVQEKEQTKQVQIVPEIAEETVIEIVEAEMPAELGQEELGQEELEQNTQVDMMMGTPEVTASSLIGEIRVLSQSGDFVAASEKVEALRQFGEFDKASRELASTAYKGGAEQLAESDNIKASYYYSKAGQIELINGDTIAAFKNFKLANELDPDNAQAMEDMLVLQKDIADKYHREASTAFRRQDLDVAIAKWDLVLDVNPQHSSANLYRAQAIELKQRLENIKKN